MIFRRRKKQATLSKMRNMLWPYMGWRRVATYYKHRILRLPHSTHRIAMGLAAGSVVSWTPTFPFQILQCYIFCRMTRANFPAALLGTAFGNPWTFPFLFVISYQVGHFCLDVTGIDDIFVLLAGETELFSQDGFGIEKFLPTLVGGYIMAALTYPVLYYSFFYLVTAGRASRKVVARKVHDIIDHRHEKKDRK